MTTTSSLRRRLTALSLGTTMMVAALGATTSAGICQTAAPAAAAPARVEIERIVREYLINNPEVIQEALQELERRQQQAQRDAQVGAIREAKASLVTAGDTIAGNPDGDVTIVEFFDYNCGFCKRAHADIEAMIKADPKLRVVFKDFPVLGPESVEASFVAIAARNQLKGEKAVEFHDRLMETRGRVNKDRALALAKEMGLDVARLQKDLESPQVREVVAQTMALGDRLALTGTPAFVIGEEVVFGAVGADALKQNVANMRACGKATCS